MASDDWGKIEKTEVNIVALMRRNPEHASCDLCIKHSKKNPLYIGLYCQQHDHWLSWINDDQQEFLKNLDSSIIDYTEPGAAQPPRRAVPTLATAPRTRL
jgi:hypothetical protein